MLSELWLPRWGLGYEVGEIWCLIEEHWHFTVTNPSFESLAARVTVNNFVNFNKPQFPHLSAGISDPYCRVAA